MRYTRIKNSEATRETNTRTAGNNAKGTDQTTSQSLMYNVQEDTSLSLLIKTIEEIPS